MAGALLVIYTSLPEARDVIGTAYLALTRDEAEELIGNLVSLLSRGPNTDTFVENTTAEGGLYVFLEEGEIGERVTRYRTDPRSTF